MHAHVHVYRHLFPAPAEDAGLSEDCEAGEPLLPGAKPAVHQCVAVSGPQLPVVSGHRSEVPGVDVGCGVGCAQGPVPSMRGRVGELRLLSTAPSVRMVGRGSWR